MCKKKAADYGSNLLLFALKFVIRMRLERMTVCLEGRCSIQLSYRTIFSAAWGANGLCRIVIVAQR